MAIVYEESACDINTNKTLYKIINVSEQTTKDVLRSKYVCCGLVKKSLWKN